MQTKNSKLNQWLKKQQKYNTNNYILRAFYFFIGIAIDSLLKIASQPPFRS